MPTANTTETDFLISSISALSRTLCAMSRKRNDTRHGAGHVMQNGIGVAENAAERARRRAANGETALFDARLVDEAHVAAPAPVMPQAPSDACAQLAEHAEVIPTVGARSCPRRPYRRRWLLPQLKVQRP